MAVVRYLWMFRTAAVVSLLLGLGWMWTALFTDRQAEHRLYVLAIGAAAVIVAFFLFRRARLAIGLSAVGALVVSVSAVLFIPKASGPGVLFLLGVAIVGGLYAALSFRVLFAARA
jgi:hypothetical protein